MSAFDRWLYRTLAPLCCRIFGHTEPYAPWTGLGGLMGGHCKRCFERIV